MQALSTVGEFEKLSYFAEDLSGNTAPVKIRDAQQVTDSLRFTQ